MQIKGHQQLAGHKELKDGEMCIRDRINYMKVYNYVQDKGKEHSAL